MLAPFLVSVVPLRTMCYSLYGCNSSPDKLRTKSCHLELTFADSLIEKSALDCQRLSAGQAASPRSQRHGYPGKLIRCIRSIALGSERKLSNSGAVLTYITLTSRSSTALSSHCRARPCSPSLV